MDDSRLKTLTTREAECLRLYHRRLDAGSVARDLSLSVNTINNHLKAARAKLGATSSRAAAVMLIEAEASHPLASEHLAIGPRTHWAQLDGVEDVATHHLRDSGAVAGWPSGDIDRGSVGGRRLPATSLGTLLHNIAWQVVACVAAVAILLLILGFARDLFRPDTFRF